LQAVRRGSIFSDSRFGVLETYDELMIHVVAVGPDLDGERVDRALATLLPDLTRSALARLIDDGCVRVDGVVRTKRSATVVSGQEISVDVPEAQPSDVVSQNLPIRIVYQDSDIAVIDKPAGMVVHPAAGHGDETLVNALLHHIGDLSGIGGVTRPGIVHRLDKDTSGLIVIAKNDTAHNALARAWGTDRVRKEYVAVVYGCPKSSDGRIEKPIGRDPRDRKRMAIVRTGRAAITLFRIEERLPHVCVLRCTLKTGRTHQIRVHLKSIGHPIVGDPLYSGPQWRGIPDRRVQKMLEAMNRQALHAQLLAFPHPRSGEIMTFEAPVPEDMAGMLEQLRAL
jgi:23S rRNA pseudouridine1911/1915/1917 synthase